MAFDYLCKTDDSAKTVPFDLFLYDVARCKLMTRFGFDAKIVSVNERIEREMLIDSKEPKTPRFRCHFNGTYDNGRSGIAFDLFLVIKEPKIWLRTNEFWRNVKSELPPQNENGMSDFYIVAGCNGKWYDRFSYDFTRQMWVDAVGDPHENVTHWMKRPEKYQKLIADAS